MTTTVSVQPTMLTRSQKRRMTPCKFEGKKFVCESAGCGRSFTRAEHLQRHLLNHSTGAYTCNRCRAHFKRRDLLERHVNRHKQKDQEAGAEGCGILNTRKRLWRDRNGNIVTQKPAVAEAAQTIESPSRLLYKNSANTFERFPSFSHHEDSVPTPPSSSRTLSVSSASEPCSSGNFSDHLPMMQNPNEQSTRLSSSGGQWPSPLISHRAELDLFSTKVTKHAPFADLLDPSILNVKCDEPASTTKCYYDSHKLTLKKKIAYKGRGAVRGLAQKLEEHTSPASYSNELA